MTVTAVHFLQHNVNRQQVAQQTVFEQALQARVDILLLQEPYLFKNNTTAPSSFVCLQHSAFHSILPQPSDRILVRPRVVTYIRKGAGFQFSPRYDLFSDPDLQAVELVGVEEPFLVINAYNEKERPDEQQQQQQQQQQ